MNYDKYLDRIIGASYSSLQTRYELTETGKCDFTVTKGNFTKRLSVVIKDHYALLMDGKYERTRASFVRYSEVDDWYSKYIDNSDMDLKNSDQDEENLELYFSKFS